MRMEMRRFTRLTNAFSKKLENHTHQMAFHAVAYNFCWIHSTVRISPTRAAGVTVVLRDMDWIVGLLEGRDSQPGPQGPYGRRGGPVAEH